MRNRFGKHKARGSCFYGGLLFSLFFLSASQALARTVQEMTPMEFMAERKPCVLAISEDSTTPYLCIFNGTLKPGTMYERTGCFLGKFDIRNGQYQKPYSYYSFWATEETADKECSPEIVKKILDTPVKTYEPNWSEAWRHGVVIDETFTKRTKHSKKNPTVKESLSKNIEVLYDEYNVLVYGPPAPKD